MEKKDEKSASRHEEGKADASADDPMLKIEEDFESKQFGTVAQSKELDLFLVSFSSVIMRVKLNRPSFIVLCTVQIATWDSKHIGYLPRG